MGAAAEFLLAELRRARKRAELTQDEFAKQINYSMALVSAVECGKRSPTRGFLAKVDEVLSTDGFFIRILDDLVSLEDAPTWLRDWIEWEREATTLRWYEPAFVPGLLQTEAYARATLAVDGLNPPEQIDQRTRSRLERQAILDREIPPQFVAVIDEAVLRRTVNGDRALMLEQLRHLIAMAQRPCVHVHVVPTEAGLYFGLQGSCILANTPDAGTVIHLDNLIRAQVTDRPADISMVMKVWEAVRSKALPEGQSLDLIKEAAKVWT